MGPRAMLSRDEEFGIALEHYQAGRLGEAFAACRALLERTPNHGEALHLSGLIAFDAGRCDIALAIVQQAVAASGDVAHHHNTLGTILAKLGRLDDAVASYRRATDLAPAEPGLLCNLGLALCRLERSGEAETVFRLALALDSTSATSPTQSGLAQALYPGDDYRTVLSILHEILNPATYLEIGVSTGASLALVRPPTLAIGIDPAPRVAVPLSATTRIFALTSDRFFAEHDLRAEFQGRPFDLAFVDGLHTFEQTLRDIANLERHASPNSVILVHDVLPCDEACAARHCHSALWAGDTWKIVPALRGARPDLDVVLIPTYPTGLAVIRGLNPTLSERLLAGLPAIVAAFMPLTFTDFLTREPERRPSMIANQRAAIAAHLTPARPNR